MDIILQDFLKAELYKLLIKMKVVEHHLIIHGGLE